MRLMAILISTQTGQMDRWIDEYPARDGYTSTAASLFTGCKLKKKIILKDNKSMKIKITDNYQRTT